MWENANTQALIFMIDIHSHILWGFDDGPANLEESLEIAVLYEKTGFTKVVATPHWVYGTAWQPDAEAVQHAVGLLNHALIKKGIQVQVLPGMEISLDAEIPALLQQKGLLTLAGSSYILIEAPFLWMPQGWEQVINILKAKGYRPIIAHPERCRQMKNTTSIFDMLIDAGVCFQVDYGAFLGHYGRHAKATALYLAQKGYCHCLATDSHDLTQRSPIDTERALKVVEAIVGGKKANVMSKINPERIVKNKPLEMPGATENKKRKKWVFF